MADIRDIDTSTDTQTDTLTDARPESDEPIYHAPTDAAGGVFHKAYVPERETQLCDRCFTQKAATGVCNCY